MLLPYELQWIAFVERRGQRTIVSAGPDPAEVLKVAEEKGYQNPIMFWVPPFRARLII